MTVREFISNMSGVSSEETIIVLNEPSEHDPRSKRQVTEWDIMSGNAEENILDLQATSWDFSIEHYFRQEEIRVYIYT